MDEEDIKQFLAVLLGVILLSAMTTFATRLIKGCPVGFNCDSPSSSCCYDGDQAGDRFTLDEM
jgi:hypothetical protein